MSLHLKNTLLLLGIVFSSQVTAAEGITRENKFFREFSLTGEKAFIKSQRIEMSPGFSAPNHRHPVPTFGVVNKGVIIYKEEGSKEVILKEGDTFYEPQGVNITKFNNAGKNVAAFTVFYIVKDESTATVQLSKK
ncbi:cupin domain-containing protein [Teredinibacter sp. KSP-S5-2]|uniref:cupin domain-containing protein n=1 Tax=Teredinibacter sp. KSP-S5-2 TaxID=3034506 RepID=UPI00293453CE|nr:cupin domain-containing protein [Teredinibacter sp. KSP-S5-2]WNO11518.1 cupin domain-containing protein [Teredinibacter sp. KSP-S5-2]